MLVESAKYALVGCAENALDMQKLQWLSVQKMHWTCRNCSGKYAENALRVQNLQWLSVQKVHCVGVKCG